MIRQYSAPRPARARRRGEFAILVVLCLAALGTGPGAHASEPTQEMPPMGRPAEMDQIAYMLGEWNVAIEMRMAPDAPFTTSTGTASVTSVLDGCVQRMDFKAEVMGMPMHGVDQTTYNRHTGRFESIWVDNLSGNFTMQHGGFEDGRCAMTGVNTMMGKEVWMKSVSEKRSDNEVFWTMDESYDGGKTWMTTMKMTYTRK